MTEQKFTHWKDIIDEEFWEFIESKPTFEEVLSKPPAFRKHFQNEINKVLCTRKEGSNIADQLDQHLFDAYNEDFRNAIWESNHSRIIGYIHNTIICDNRVPNKTEISQQLGLSRTTVHKHLNNVSENNYYKEEIESFKVLVPKMLMMLYKEGIHNVAASRLFLNLMGMKETPIAKNNFIQINNTTITENTFHQLDPDKQRLIETWFAEIEDGS